MLSPLILNKIGGFEMAKFGRKNHVNLDPLSYSSCLLGEAKVGKTTLVRQVCASLSPICATRTSCLTPT